MGSESQTRHSVAALIKKGVLLVGDGYRAKRAELADEGYPFARAGNVNGGFQFEDADLLGWPAVERAKEKVSCPGDVVFTSKGTVGRFAWVSEDTPTFVYSPQLCFWRSLDQGVLASKYLYYWLRSPEFLHQVAAVKGQTDMADYVSLRDQRRMTITVPDLPVQQQISSILGALDDKIELNRKMSRTLEEIAQTLFRAWFVDFEGERDLVDSELGPIPRGWRVARLEELAVLVQETIRPNSSPDATWEHFSLPAFDSGKLPHYQQGSEIKSGKYRVPADSVLISKLNPRFPRVWRVKVTDPEIAVCSTEFLPFVAWERQLRPYLYELLSSESVTAAVQSRVTGTTGSRQRVKPRDVARLPIPLPPDDEVLRDFSRRVAPIHERVQLNLDEAATLAQLRDTLLPKLISGEIRVPEAEARVEEAV